MSSEAQKLLVPGSVKIESAILTNYSGETVDIKVLIGELVITESINSMFCVFDIVVVDGVGLLEKYAISGNEKIELELSKRDTEGGNDIFTTKHLAIIGVNEYARTTNESQAYKIQAVSETALHCSVKRLSKSVNGSIGKIITDLYGEDAFNLPLNVVDGKKEGNYRFVLPNYTVTDTFAMLLAKAQNKSSTTYHLFESLWGDMVLTSYDEIIKQSPVDTYKLMSFETENDLRQSAFDEIRTKIKQIDSYLGLSHYESFKKGGIAARVFMNDISTKTFEKKDYNLLDEDLGRLDKDYILSDTYTIAGKPVADLRQPKTYMVNKNTMAFTNSENGQNRVDVSIAKKRFRYENQFAISHNVKLAGDTRLKAGSIVDITLPTPTDPKFLSEVQDDYFSGKYFVSSVRHNIVYGGSYTADLSVRKDSIDRERMISKYKSMNDVR